MDTPPVLQPIQVDFSRYTADVPVQEAYQPEPEQPEPAGAVPGGGTAVESPQVEGAAAQEPPQPQQPLPPHAAAAVAPGALSAEESPLPGRSGYTFEEMVERALSEGGGSPFGVQQLAGPREARPARLQKTNHLRHGLVVLNPRAVRQHRF